MTSCNEDDVNNKETNFRSEQKGGIFHWYTLGSLAKLGWVGDNKTMSEHSWIHFYVSWKGLTTLLMDLSNKESLKQCFLHLYIKIICDIDSSKMLKQNTDVCWNIWLHNIIEYHSILVLQLYQLLTSTLTSMFFCYI